MVSSKSNRQTRAGHANISVDIPYFSVPLADNSIIVWYAIIIHLVKMFQPFYPIWAILLSILIIFNSCCNSSMILDSRPMPVSYTHLDVYKRQQTHTSNFLFFIFCHLSQWAYDWMSANQWHLEQLVSIIKVLVTL